MFGIICYIILASILIGVNYKYQKPAWMKEVIKFFFVLYILMVVSVTLFPLALWIDYNIEHVKYSLNLIPFVSILKDFGQIGKAYDGNIMFMIEIIIKNVGGNILLFLPLGFLLPILSKKYKHFKYTLLLGFLVSLSIESVQFLELLAGAFERTVDIDDVICNVIGVCIGYFIFKIMFRLSDKFHIKFLHTILKGNNNQAINRTN